jgi:two-component system, cell cycle response regulator
MKNILRLLYVEDDQDTRTSVSEVLRLGVDELHIAKDGAEALEIFKAHPVEFVISDFRMPKMNGNELCAAIKEIDSETYFVLFTAYNDTDLLIEAINAGVDRFLLKPLDSKQLFSMLDKIKSKIEQHFNLSRARAYLRDAEKIANLFYWDYNLNTKIMNFEKEVAELFDLPQELKTKLDYKTFSTMVLEEDRNKFLNIFENKIFNKETVDEIVVIKNQKGKHKYLRIATSRCENFECGDMYIIGIFQDISSYEEQLEILKDNKYGHMLRIDNKQVLISQLDEFMKFSVQESSNLAVHFFRIDNYKYIVDKYGQMLADAILVELVNLIKSNVSQRLYFGKWSENEFVIVTINGNHNENLKLSRELLEKIESHSWAKNISLMINAGLAFYEAGNDAKSLIQKANLKMLEDKKTIQDKRVH